MKKGSIHLSLIVLVLMLLILPVAIFVTKQREGSQNINSKASEELPSPSPAPVTHLECLENACVKVPGTGEDLCMNDDECRLLEPSEIPR